MGSQLSPVFVMDFFEKVPFFFNKLKFWFPYANSTSIVWPHFNDNVQMFSDQHEGTTIEIESYKFSPFLQELLSQIQRERFIAQFFPKE